MRTGNWITDILTSCFFLMLLVVFISGYVVNRFVISIGGSERIPEIYGIWAPTVTITIFVVLNLSYFPADLIAIANGAMYGVVLGAALTWIARMIVAVVEYRIGKQGGEDLDLDSRLEKVPWLARFPVSHPVFLICIRYVPYGGGHLANLAAGSRHVPLRRHLWTSAISIAPAAIALAAMGAAMLPI